MVGSELVSLRGGLTVPAEPLLLIFELERRGFTLETEGEDTLIVQPHDRLTREDCARIRRWKFHILSLVAYEAPTCA
jgi:hypothetical protein